MDNFDVTNARIQRPSDDKDRESYKGIMKLAVNTCLLTALFFGAKCYQLRHSNSEPELPKTAEIYQISRDDLVTAEKDLNLEPHYLTQHRRKSLEGYR